MSEFHISRPLCKSLWESKDLSSCWSLISYFKLRWGDYTKMSPFSASLTCCVAGHAPLLWQHAGTIDSQQIRETGKGWDACEACTCLKGQRDLHCFPTKDGTSLLRVKSRQVFLSPFLRNSLHPWYRETNKCQLLPGLVPILFQKQTSKISRPTTFKQWGDIQLGSKIMQL